MFSFVLPVLQLENELDALSSSAELVSSQPPRQRCGDSFAIQNI